MKIDNHTAISTSGKQQAREASADRSRARPPRDDKPSSGGDRVNLTGTAQQLQALEARIMTQPRVDKQRVEAVKAALENGTLTVDPERIAERLIGIEQALKGNN
jgi:negative regulator of flagellin synthesis FlgM